MTDAPMGVDALPDGSWTVFRLPRSHWHCQLSNFKWATVRPASLEQRMIQFVRSVEAGDAPHLIMTGEPGIGKSHLGAALYRQGVRLCGTAAATWINVPDFCDRVKRSYDGHADPFLEYSLARRLVVLDDLFGRDLSPHEISQILYRLIDIAYMNSAAVVLNMNAPVEDMTQYLRPHEVSRVLAGSTIIPMSSDRDWRRGGA